VQVEWGVGVEDGNRVLYKLPVYGLLISKPTKEGGVKNIKMKVPSGRSNRKTGRGKKPKKQGTWGRTPTQMQGKPPAHLPSKQTGKGATHTTRFHISGWGKSGLVTSRWGGRTRPTT